MDQQSSVESGSALSSWWQYAKPMLARVPGKAWVVLGLFLVAALFLAVYTAVSSADASVHLKVQHGFRSAQLSVWVDDKLALSTRVSGATKKRFGLIPDSVQGNLSQAIPVSSGSHAVRVRLEPDDGSAVEDTISGEVASHSERELSVAARRGGVSLAWQGSAATASAASAPSGAGAGWFGRYAGSLFLTIAGSIISALTGYAIRELPGHLRGRQDPEPKA
jgi:hypothetical protein